MLTVLEYVNTTTGEVIAKYQSKVGALKTYKEILIQTWNATSVKGVTLIHPKAESKKIVGIYIQKDAYIDLGQKNRQINIKQEAGKPNPLPDADFASFVTVTSVPVVEQLKKVKVITPSPAKKKPAMVAKKKNK
jgi:hypothetical protein